MKIETKVSAKLVPELIVSDLETSLKFWCELIGFKVSYDRPEEKFAYLDLEGAQVMLEQRAPETRQWITGLLEIPLGRGINMQIETSDLASIVDRLQDAELSLFMEPETKQYRIGNEQITQKQCLVQDPDGYLLRLFQHVESTSSQ